MERRHNRPTFSNDVSTPVVQDVIPGKTKEETRRWKEAKKSSYSQRLPRKSFEDLKNEFNTGYVEGDRFIVDDNSKEPMRRIFDSRGFEIEREFYKPGSPNVDNVIGGKLIKRMQSEYDDEGYLIGVIALFEGKGGYIRKIEYDYIDDKKKIKVPTRAITQDVVPNPRDESLRVPGWPVGYKPQMIMDFTDVDYIPPEKLNKESRELIHDHTYEPH